MTGLRPRLTLVALAAALSVIFLALPAVAAAAEEFSLEVDFAGSGEGAVGCVVDGGPLEECEAEYEEGAEVELIAEPEWGSEFTEWGGDCTGLGACELEMDADKTVEATFDLEEFELTVGAEGNGEGVVECQIDGGPYELCPASETYPYGTEAILFAEPEEGSEFTEWGGDCSGVEAECALTIEEPLAVTATFEPEPPFALEIVTDGSGSGEVECEVEGGEPEECEAEYDEGTEVALIPVAETGSEFTGWSGDCTGTGACELTMDVDKEVTATFDEEEAPTPEYDLTITKAGTGSGSVTCDGGACAPTYEEGEEITLAATAASGSSFAGWSGGGCSGTGTCVVTITADTTVTATFTANPPPPTCQTDPSLCPPAPAPAPTPAPTPTEGKAKAAASAIFKGGKAELKLTCTGGPCKGTVKLTAKVKQGGKTKNLQIGQASFSIAAGATATVKVKLSGPAKTELGKGKTLKAKTSGTGLAGSTVKVKPAKKAS
jgi:hypothetical protein